jgi:hypothetical protein
MELPVANEPQIKFAVWNLCSRQIVRLYFCNNTKNLSEDLLGTAILFPQLVYFPRYCLEAHTTGSPA